MQRQASPNTRRDGWIVRRQLRFLDMLDRTRCVTRAAAAAGLSRKSAYRLRARADGALFAALWDRAISAPLDATKVTTHGGSHLRLPAENPGNPPKVTKWRKWKDPRFDPFAQLLRDLGERGSRAVTSVTLDGRAEPPKFHP